MTTADVVPDHTAIRVALWRALHLEVDAAPPVLDDSLGLLLADPEPGWRDRFESITVYQRGWRLGGKGASSRGEHGRIEEHGLHVWIGSYENAFALIRECYAELDRTHTDPSVPIRTWDQAFVPANDVGTTDRWNDEYSWDRTWS